MFHQRYSTRSEALNDSEWGMVNNLNTRKGGIVCEYGLLCDIAVQNEDKKTVQKIFDLLIPKRQQILRYQLNLSYRIRKEKDQKIMDELKKNKFYSLTCQQQFYIIKICYTKKQQQERYINQVIDMALQQTTQKSANRIYNNLPESYKKIYFQPQIRWRLYPNDWDQQEGKISLKRRPSDLTCKDSFLRSYRSLKNIIKKMIKI